MGMKEIENEIREGGSREVKSINLEAEKELKRINAEIKEKAESEAKKLESDNLKRKDLERKRILAKANLSIKEQIEKKKDEMIEKVFDDAGKRILSMKDSEKSKILRVLADEGRTGLEKPTVFVDRKYSRLLKGAKTADIGDFGVRVTSGHVSVDNTLTAKLMEIKSSSRHKVADLLWQD